MRTKDSRAVLRGLGHSNVPRLPGELDQTLEMPFVLAAVEQALASASPVIVNSDQGSHFTSPQYTKLLKAHAVQISRMAKVALSILSLRKGCGGPSNMRTFTCKIINPHGKHGRGSGNISAFTISSDRIKHLATLHRPKSTLGRSNFLTTYLAERRRHLNHSSDSVLTFGSTIPRCLKLG